MEREDSSWGDLLHRDTKTNARRWLWLAAHPEAEIKEKFSDLAAQSPKTRVAVRVVRGECCETEGKLFDEWARALNFPEYFGHNWDAFDEVLGDFLVLDEGGLGSYWGGRPDAEQAEVVIILVTHAGKLLCREDENHFDILLDVIKTAALGLRWDSPTLPHSLASLQIILQCKESEVTSLRDRLNKAGASPALL